MFGRYADSRDVSRVIGFDESDHEARHDAAGCDCAESD